MFKMLEVHIKVKYKLYEVKEFKKKTSKLLVNISNHYCCQIINSKIDSHIVNK